MYTHVDHQRHVLLLFHSADSYDQLPTIVDLRDPSTIPLNFTKSINLALSERGLNSMLHTDRTELIEKVRHGTIPMYGRMIHGKDRGQLYEAPQTYDIHGRVGTRPIGMLC